jgi:purine-binding chemotaxis protein CheW
MTLSGQYLTLSLAGETYGLEILRVREIIAYVRPTKVPSTAPAFAGVINVRGSVVPVVDLAVRFGLAPTTTTKRTCIVLLEHGADARGEGSDDAPTIVGVIAEAVHEVLELAPGDVEATPTFGTRAGKELVLGMARRGAGFVLLLDVARALDVDHVVAPSASLGAEGGAA